LVRWLPPPLLLLLLHALDRRSAQENVFDTLYASTDVTVIPSTRTTAAAAAAADIKAIRRGATTPLEQQQDAMVRSRLVSLPYGI
jgi:hypothetical protein